MGRHILVTVGIAAVISLPVVMRAAADFILERDAHAVGKSIVGDKSPSSVFHGLAVRKMAAVYPDGRLINIVRDGRGHCHFASLSILCR